MTGVRFKISTGSGSGMLGQLSVDVLDSKLRLRGRGPLSERMTLEQGFYFAEAMLPSRQKGTASPPAGPAREQGVNLNAERTEFTPRSSKAEARNASVVVADQASVATTRGEDSSGAGLTAEAPSSAESDALDPATSRVIATPSSRDETTTNELSGEYRVVSGNRLTRNPKDARVEWLHFGRSDKKEISGSSVLQTLQFSRPGEPTANIALPLEPGGTCSAILRVRAPGHILPHILFADSLIELMLRFSGAGMISEVVKIAESHGILPEKLTDPKRQPPIRAVCAAYILLRTGQLDRLQDWTARLEQECEWMPDAAAIRGEHLARLGRHQEAMKSLLKLSSRGLPFFSSGLSYALDRLTQYQAFAASRSAESQSAASSNQKLRWTKKAATLLDRLRDVARRTDFSRPILTYTTADTPKLPAVDKRRAK